MTRLFALIDIFLPTTSSSSSSSSPFPFSFQQYQQQYQQQRKKKQQQQQKKQQQQPHVVGGVDVTNLVQLATMTAEAAGHGTSNALLTLQEQVFACYTNYGNSGGEDDAFEIIDPMYHQEEDPLNTLVQPLLQDIVTNNNNNNSNLDRKRLQALQSLYHLVDFAHKENRVPLVCRRSDPPLLKTVHVLASSCLLPQHEDSSATFNSEHRRWACLILNNLSIPMENKAVLINHPLLMDALLYVIQHRFPETHLCCVCLMNLSFIDTTTSTTPTATTIPATITSTTTSFPISQVMLQYQMTTSTTTSPTAADAADTGDVDNNNNSIPLSTILGNPHSLLRIMESMMRDYTSILMMNSTSNNTPSSPSSSQLSVQGEAIRWTVGWMRNITQDYTCCQWLCQTQLIYDMILIFHYEIMNAIRQHHNNNNNNLTKKNPKSAISLLCATTNNNNNNNSSLFQNETTTTNQQVPSSSSSPDASPTNSAATSSLSISPSLASTTTTSSSSSSTLSSSPTTLSTSFVSKWTRDSLPDLTLGVLVHLVQYADCCQCLLQENSNNNTTTTTASLLFESLQPILHQGGIHDMRASMILCQLEQQQQLLLAKSRKESTTWNLTKTLFPITSQT